MITKEKLEELYRTLDLVPGTRIDGARYIMDWQVRQMLATLVEAPQTFPDDDSD